MTDKFSPYFDPDEIVLTKAILRDLINALIARWQEKPQKHRVQIMALETFRLSLRFQSDESVAEIIKSIVTMVNEMQMYNALMKLKDEMPTTRQLADMAIHKIRNGPA